MFFLIWLHANNEFCWYTMYGRAHASNKMQQNLAAALSIAKNWRRHTTALTWSTKDGTIFIQDACWLDVGYHWAYEASNCWSYLKLVMVEWDCIDCNDRNPGMGWSPRDDSPPIPNHPSSILIINYPLIHINSPKTHHELLLISRWIVSLNSMGKNWLVLLINNYLTTKASWTHCLLTDSWISTSHHHCGKPRQIKLVPETSRFRRKLSMSWVPLLY